MSYVRSLHPRFTSTIAAAAALAALAACSDSNPTGAAASRDALVADASAHATPHTVYGEPVSLGHGHARTYMIVDAAHHNTPMELGVALDENALQGLTNDLGEFEHLLQLPDHAPAPFKFVELDWNPQGHPPEGVYTVPHFDFHFYKVTLDERNAIDPADDHFAEKANNLPGAAYVPSHYVVPGPPAAVAVPRMGVHWSDTRSPELQNLLGNPAGYHAFTSTFINGSWDGHFTFEEPMVTRDFILSKKHESDPAMRDQVMAVGTAEHYSAAGYHANAYRVGYDDATHTYRIALTHLTENRE
jgi:hypothetical protein